ncbi:MAG: filamentous hemagglutinin N-terminal domain-containing protein, partial [Xenococcus sp. (in: cyanobacteria)]
MQQKFSLPLSLAFYLVASSLQFSSALAQVTPDGTTNTSVDVSGNDFTINQGERAGGNLFHSFGEFSVPTDGSAFFNNAADIVNIFSRVTGGNISNIDGLLGANGTANLFLINPAGIIFGEGARLNIGGSFYGSTADSIIFSDGEFSASDLANPPLITINAPIGLNFRDNPEGIVNRSFVQDDTGDVVGLEVISGQNLTLVGGNINFETGNATASGGNIELGGLSTEGTVGINDDGSLSFPKNVAKVDITLSNGAGLDVTGIGEGTVTINARNISLEAGEFGGSFIIAGSTSTDAQARDITINATQN